MTTPSQSSAMNFHHRHHQLTTSQFLNQMTKSMPYHHQTTISEPQNQPQNLQFHNSSTIIPKLPHGLRTQFITISHFSLLNAQPWLLHHSIPNP
jgi:hypothetical protein